MIDQIDVQIFEDYRPRLLGLAYRILGSLSDAEDAVQDTFLKWAKADRKIIENPSSWLTTICTRRCLDLLRAAHHTRVEYVGAWLPEPIQKPIEDDSDNNLDLVTSLKTAFLLMLDRLTPKERAAYLLHEIFDTPYVDVAQTLDINESACRKLVSRAKSNIDQTKTRFTTPLNRQNELLSAFQIAIKKGQVTEQLTSLLSDDIRLTADGGGKVPTILEILSGTEEVTTFLTNSLHEYWSEYEWGAIDINGERGFVLKNLGHFEATVSFSYDHNGKANNIYIVRNPEKLTNLNIVSIH